MMWFFIADRTSMLVPEDKEYVRDRFAFIFLTLILVAGWTSTAKVKAAVLLNRQQTEEWKGWMQARVARSCWTRLSSFLVGTAKVMRVSSREQCWPHKGWLVRGERERLVFCQLPCTRYAPFRLQRRIAASTLPRGGTCVAADDKMLTSQVLFLLYHYFNAGEMYNAIRVFIAAYVWMTGFGNYLYYYKTNDFSGVRRASLPELDLNL